MDEESVGLFGVLLIVTALVLSHPLKPAQAVAALPSVNWQDVVGAFSCGDAAAPDCYATLGQ